MKGTLRKLSKGWTVWYNEEPIGGNMSFVDALPLHPDDVKQIEADNLVFDNIEARIATYPEIEFDIIEQCPNYNSAHIDKDCSCKTGFIEYAKLRTINVSDDFQIGPNGAFERLEIDKEELYKLYMEWVDNVLEECDWKTSFGPEEIVHAIANILESNPHLITITYNNEKIESYE